MQRRKGNAQCASSNKAAEMLQSTGNFVPLLGLEGLQIPSLETNEILPAEFDSVSPDVRIVLKKLSKRDSMTREKAIKEILEIIQTLSTDDLKPIFACFSTYYPRLVTDSVALIRSSANSALAAFLKVLRKNAEGPEFKKISPFLLFSLGDVHAAVRRSVERLLDDCFPGDKRQLFTKAFAKPTISLAMEMINRKHKLIQPQQTASDESDEQRQSRLISQSLATVEFLLDQDEHLATAFIQNFSQPSTITALTKTSTTIKSALFSLLKRLVQINAEPFFDSKILALILANLDSDELGLCRNAFECLLVLGADERFRENCKFEKAVVPKFLAMVRKKSMHWSVLESSLLPSFILICKSLPDSARSKWIFSLVDSFFDGDLPMYLIAPWSKAFVEIAAFLKTSYSDNSNVLSHLQKKAIAFVELIVDRSVDDEKLMSLTADLIISSCTADDDEFTRELCFTILNRLPKTQRLASILLSRWTDKFYLKKLLNCDSVPDELLVDALQKDMPFAIANLENIGDFLLKRICDSLFHKEPLLQILCDLIVDGKVENLLTGFVKNDPKNCLLFLDIPPPKLAKIFNGQTRENIAKQIVDGILQKNISLPISRAQHLVHWLIDLDQSSTEGDAHICAPLLDLCLEVPRLSDFTVKLYDEFFKGGKVGVNQEKIIANKLFECLISESTNLSDINAAVELLGCLKIDLDVSLAVLKRLFASPDVDYSSILKMANMFNALKFTNVPSLNFHPSPAEVDNLANTLEKLFLLEILSQEESFLFSFVPARPMLYAALAEHDKGANVFDYLFECAKRALFLKQIGCKELPIASRAFIWLTATFVNFFCASTFSMESREVLAQFTDELNKVEVDAECLLEILQSVLTSEEKFETKEICIPISLIFALRTLGKAGIDLAKLNEFLKFTVVKRCPSLAFAFVLNFSASSAEIPLLTINAQSASEGDCLCGWVYEFERACATFNPENRAEHFVKLSMFVEKQEYNDWLFTLQGDNAARDVLSCVLLRLCVKVAPYMIEVDGPIRDFINCGIITAFQSCTDNILLLEPNGSNRNPLLFVLAQLCLKLLVTYENCITANASNVDYANIKQEWNEFFSPSAVNFIFSWFINLVKDQNLYPPGFTLELCRMIQFIDDQRIFGAELLKNFANTKDYDNLADKFFSDYPSPQRDILCVVASLLLSEKAEIQLAATKVLQSNLSFMFTHENVKTSTKDASEPFHSSANALNLSEGYDMDEEEEEQTQSRVPKFLEAILQREFPVKETDQKLPIPIVLLSWEAFVRFISNKTLDGSSRVLICEAFSTHLIDAALERLLSGLPDPPFPVQSKGADDLFVADVDMYRMTAFDYSKFLCNLYYRSLICVPALIRQWHSSLGSSIANAIRRYTRKYVSPAVVRYEISRVGGASSRRFGRLEVRVLGAVNEVIAGYRFDDTTISLHISLPEDFPLSLVTISTERKIVQENLHRKWLLQLEKFLSHENGSLMDGIMQWKRNIDRHLEGVDDCTICMLTVSLTNHQLPRIRCRQCRNKFHGDCLYKWFKTSSNTSCPLCRANFVR